jgi:predicted branched-subunit amino acid permease
MARRPTRTALMHGLRDCAPFNIVIVPFSLLFGVLAAEAGWNLPHAVAMSLVVIAGASQFAAVQLVKENAPFLVIVLTGLAVNLRMAMYSASLAPHLGAAPLWQRALAAYALTDQVYGVSINHFAHRPLLSVPEKMAYYAGAALAICPVWYAFTVVGARLGQAIPAALALDFAAPITFIALFAPALRSLPHLFAAAVASGAALALAWLPYNLWMIAAALLGMGAGAGLEAALARKRA